MNDQSNITNENAIIIIGSKNVGKTSMVYKFLDKDEIPKPTIAVDYSFGRKGAKSLVKDVIHVWEIGDLASSLIAAAITGAMHLNGQTTIIIMLDLSTPQTLWSTLEDSLSAARNAIKMNYAEEIIQTMKQKRVHDMQKNFTLLNEMADYFPLNLCIIGGKYDQFQNLDLGTKQLIGKTLRGVAFVTGADLQYYSSKDRALIKKIKDLLSHHGFNGHAVKGLCSDYEKPLLIPAGSDSFAEIDHEYPGARVTTVIETVKQVYLAEYPHDPSYDEVELEDPSNDSNFDEAAIDYLRSQREEEIGINLHQMMEGKFPKIIVADPY